MTKSTPASAWSTSKGTQSCWSLWIPWSSLDGGLITVCSQVQIHLYLFIMSLYNSTPSPNPDPKG